MYSTFTIAQKYLKYYFTASNGKGHGIHSPFVFKFITDILNDRKEYGCYEAIEKRRDTLLANRTEIQVQDFGAGSGKIKRKGRPVHVIAGSSLKSKKYARLLFRMVQYFKPATILELGTSFGITTAYLANGNPKANLYSLEGATAIAAIASENFKHLGISNIQLQHGDFSDTLTPLLSRLHRIDFAFVDGNHRKAPTLQYFEQLLKVSTHSTILVFDDIHWSKEMEEAWETIKSNPAVILSIDLFFIGIVFFQPDFKEKQHFVIRF